MVEHRNKTKPKDEEDLETLSNQPTGHYAKSSFAFVSKQDHLADFITETYLRMQSDAYMPIKIGFFIATPVVVGLFTLFVSNTTSNTIAFTAFVNALCYIVYAIWMLGWILEKEIGPRSM